MTLGINLSKQLITGNIPHTVDHRVKAYNTDFSESKTRQENFILGHNSLLRKKSVTTHVC